MKQALGIAVALLLIGLGFVIYATGRDVPAADALSATATPEASFAYANATADDIVVDAPRPGAASGRTVTITGVARGTWYFEASFPAKLVAADGTTTLAQAAAQAQGDWMTTGLVPFSVSLDAGSYQGPATIVLSRDNPSGLPTSDASVSFPVTIEGAATGTATSSALR
ncbi:MAG TPA: Gmad2 immunoglobulin-like domain-containing protein [Candidatus Paceibacterota bacterium]|nr:Gmad2 immunoglobulin-like domain-containing protein [Candidatus Paceibacterota bacterium]